MKLCVLVVAAVVFSPLAGCRSELSGPPKLRLGRDGCGECGMLVNEDRCSSGLLVERGGRREHLLFDDIGCMIDSERWGLEDTLVIDRYVHDHGTRAWVRASEATFLFADRERLKTPMGSGIVAFAARADAEAAQRMYGGELLDLATLVEARRRWLEERFGKRPD